MAERAKDKILKVSLYTGFSLNLLNQNCICNIMTITNTIDTY